MSRSNGKPGVFVDELKRTRGLEAKAATISCLGRKLSFGQNAREFFLNGRVRPTPVLRGYWPERLINTESGHIQIQAVICNQRTEEGVSGKEQEIGQTYFDSG